MNKPTKIQRTVEFDNVLDEARLIIEAEVRVGLQSVIDLIDTYDRVDRKDHAFLLSCIDDIRRRLFGLDIHLGDAAHMIDSHRKHLSETQSAEQKPDSDVAALQSAVAGLKSSMAASAGSPTVNEQEDPKG